MRKLYNVNFNMKTCYVIILILFGQMNISAQENVLNFEGPVDATYDYIEVPDDTSLDFTTNFTFETWVNFDFIHRNNNGWDWQCLFAKSRYNGSYGLMYLSDTGFPRGVTFYHAGFGTGATTYRWPTVAANTWYHIAITLSPTKATIYINGVEVMSQTGSGSLTPNDNPLRIGAGSTAGGDPYPFDGNLEETRLWNYTRSEAEIKSTMNSELVGDESGLVLYYKYNQGTAGADNTGITEVTDSSTSGNNGALNQFALDGTASNFINDVQNQTITFNALSDVTYGDANFDLAATSDSGLEVTYTSSDTSVATISGNTVTIVGAGTTTITASQAGNAIFNAATDVPQMLTVNTLPIEITADAKTKYVGAVDPEFTYTVTSGAIVNGDTFSGSLSRATGETVGTYAINQGTLNNINYNVTFISNGLTVLNPSEITWDGNASSAWIEGMNWDNGSAPNSGSDVVIPNVATSPLINTATKTEINSVTINASSSLSISGNLTVNANFSNNGTVSMTSTASNSASLIVKGTANGQVTYERGGLKANVWSIVSAPVSGQSIKEFVENAANNIRINTSTTPHRYAVSYYDDSQPSGSKWVYFDVDYLTANPNETFEKGRSYAISRGTDGVVSFTGTIETTDTPKTVVASEWNAIGNPYTAFLPINENSGTNFINENLTKFDPVNVGVYVWDNAQSKYVGKSLVTDEASFAPGQGFFVKTTAGVNNVIFNQAQRMVQPLAGGTFSRAYKEVPSIQLQATLGKITLDTNIKFYENATLGLDPGYDLGNYPRSKFDIYTRLVDSSEGEDFTIQSLPTQDIVKTIIPIGVKAALGSSITFSINHQNLPEDLTVFIEDKKLNTFTKLDATKDEVYTVKIEENINGVGRFYLHTKTSEIPENVLNANDIKIYNVDNTKLIIEGLVTGEFNIQLYNTVATKVMDQTIQGQGKNIITLPVLQSGVYIVRVNTVLGIKSKKIIIK